MSFCPNCGTEAEGVFCPECGTKIVPKSSTNAVNDESQTVQAATPIQPNVSAQAVPQTQAPLQPQTTYSTQPASPYVKNSSQGSELVIADEKKGKGFAIASLVMGIISICTIGALFLPEVLGIVFAFVSKNGKPMRGLAKAGLICSIVGGCLFFMLMLI